MATQQATQRADLLLRAAGYDKQAMWDLFGPFKGHQLVDPEILGECQAEALYMIADDYGQAVADFVCASNEYPEGFTP